MNGKVWIVLVLCAAVVSSAALVNYGLRDSSPDPKNTRRLADGNSALVWSGHVDLRHGTLALNPVRSGRVAKLLVQENDEVAQGALLLQLDDEMARLQVQEAELGLKSAEKQFAKAQRLPEQFQAKIEQQKNAIEALGKRLEKTKQLVTVKQKLLNSSLLGKEELAITEIHADELEAMLDAEKSKLSELKANEPNLDLELAQLVVNHSLGKLEQAKKELSAHALTAPVAGKILQILVQTGDVLAPTQPRPALIFAAQGPLIVRAEIDQEFADRARLGQKVDVEDDTNADVFCQGKITFVSDWFLPRRVHEQDPTRFNSARTAECIITLDPKPPKLRIGQRVHVRLKKSE